MFSHLASLLNLIEETGEWPTSLVTGYTTMLPKPDGPAVPGPMDMRPISVLPHIYRLYSKTRFRDSISWQAHWIHDRAFGGVPKRSAETLASQVALAVEAAHSQSKLAGGISYDFAKSFDVIPVNVMLDTLQARGASKFNERSVQTVEQNVQNPRVFFRILRLQWHHPRVQPITSRT
jgi:hypothetical protein